MNDIEFANPAFFFLFVLIPLSVVWYILKTRRAREPFTMSSLGGFIGSPPSFRQRLNHLPFIFRMLALALGVVILARPQSSSSEQNITSEGIDIVLAMDISGSMTAEDFSPNRVGAAKAVAKSFVDGRQNDRIGLVIFSGESFSLCPITTDHGVLKSLIDTIQPGMLEDGTAIGDGLETAVARIKDSKSKSKVIILLTDGVNNRGQTSPMDAAGDANLFGIRVYTIGVGKEGYAPMPVRTPFGKQYQQMKVDLDENMLKGIAKTTGGKYFRAIDNNKLKEIYKEIDALEKTKIEMTEFRKHSEKYFPFALAACALLMCEVLLRYTLLRSLP